MPQSEFIWLCDGCQGERLLSRHEIWKVVQADDSTSNKDRNFADRYAHKAGILQDHGPDVNGAVVCEGCDRVISAHRVRVVGAEGRITHAPLDDIHSLLSDPAWADSLVSIEATENHVSGIASGMGKAARQMPEIAHSPNEIAKTSSRYRCRILRSGIFRAVARSFF